MALHQISSVTFRKLKVFSTKKVTLRAANIEGSAPLKKYWLVESDEKSALIIRALDEETWLPTGNPHPITVRELHTRYTPEPDSYSTKVQQSLEKQQKKLPPTPPVTVAPPEPVRQPPDEAALREHFQEGLELLDKGETEKAVDIFNELLHAEIAFEEKHKHLFNELGIELRKNNLCGQAIAYYTRALELSWGTEDENLHINLARVLCQNQQYGACLQHLFDSLRIAPGHETALNFLSWMNRMGVVPKQFSLQVKGHLVTGAALREAALGVGEGGDTASSSMNKGSRQEKARVNEGDTPAILEP